MGFYHFDCTDAALQAFHRAVVPVTMPYIELLEESSWWSSQAMLFFVTLNCFPSYAVYQQGMHFIKNTHSSYPKNRSVDSEIIALNKVFKGQGLQPVAQPKHNVNQGNCSATAADKVFKNTSWLSCDWQKSPTFTQCLRGMTKRFDAYVNGSELVQLDGARFSKDGRLP